MQLTLAPTFHPPKRSLARNQSRFDRLKMLLTEFHPISTWEPSSVENVGVFPSTNLKENENDSKCLELFDGDLIIDTPASAHVKRNILFNEEKSSHAVTSSTPIVTSSLQSLSNLNVQSLNKILDSQPQKAAQKRLAGKCVSKEIEHSLDDRKKARIGSVSTQFVMNDFVGIEKFCRNAGASIEGLRALLKKIKNAKSVVMTVLWKCLTTNHATTSVKYCTQSSICSNWNCTCDRQVRAQYAANNLLGVIISMPSSTELQTETSTMNHCNEFVYFIPLVPCLEVTYSEDQSLLVHNDNSLPLQCATTLQARWEALLSILSHNLTVKILFNTQLALMPLLQYCAVAGDKTTTPQYCSEITAAISDPRLAAYLCDSDIAENDLELYNLFDKYKVRSSIHTDVAGLGRLSRAILKIQSEQCSLWNLHKVLEAQLIERSLQSIYHTVEMPVSCLLSSMELCGVVISTNYLDDTKAVLMKRIAETESMIYQCIDNNNNDRNANTTRINIASPEQVSKLLYDSLRLRPPTTTTTNNNTRKTTSSRHQSTSMEDLMHIRDQHPVVDMILSYRGLTKLCSTYIDGIRDFICKDWSIQWLLVANNQLSHNNSNSELLSKDVGDVNSVLMNNARSVSLSNSRLATLQYRIHANWNQTIVRTGRLSCSKPNLQNIPNNQIIATTTVTANNADSLATANTTATTSSSSSSSEGINMRTAFCATKGCILVSADYSQIEMRVLAHLCGDPALLALFRCGSGADIYRRLAAAIMHKHVDSVLEEERTKAKVICLGVLYGMGAQATASKLGIDIASASRITQSFFDNFRTMKAWILQIKAQAKKQGYVRTLLGRIRYLPDLLNNGADTAKISAAERQAVNSVIQGTASDIIKCAMINVDRQLAKEWHCRNNENSADSLLVPRLVMQIHDELIYEVPINNNSGSSSSSDTLHRFIQLLQVAMVEQIEKTMRFTVPLIINIHTGDTWGDMKPEAVLSLPNSLTSTVI